MRRFESSRPSQYFQVVTTCALLRTQRGVSPGYHGGTTLQGPGLTLADEKNRGAEQPHLGQAACSDSNWAWRGVRDSESDVRGARSVAILSETVPFQCAERGLTGSCRSFLIEQRSMIPRRQHAGRQNHSVATNLLGQFGSSRYRSAYSGLSARRRAIYQP